MPCIIQDNDRTAGLSKQQGTHVKAVQGKPGDPIRDDRRDEVQMFRDKGWTPIDSQLAFEDSVYALRPDILPAGESILWAIAKQRGVDGLRYPGADDVYEKPILDRSHL